MNVYQSIKNLGKKVLLVGGLALVLNGCFEQRSPIPLKSILVDVNQDKTKDIVHFMHDTSVGLFGSNDIYVSLNSNGSFAEEKKVLHLRGRPLELNVEDLDGDNIPDLSYVMYDNHVGMGGSWDMYLAKGNGDGTFQKPSKIRHYKNRPN